MDSSNSSDSDFSGNCAKDMSYSSLQEIPDDILDKSFKLRALSLSHNQLSPCLGPKIAGFKNLIKLDISNNNLSRLSEDFHHLVKLRTLIARNNQFNTEGIGKSLSSLKNLEDINMSGNQFTEIPPCFLKLCRLRYLHMGANQIRELPSQVKELTHLEVLYIGGNQLTEIPAEVGCLTKLNTLALCDNKIHTLPRSLGQLHKLRTLSLHNNRISMLPQEIVSLNLIELSLRNNPLVVRFVKDLVCDPPSLLELAGRTIKVEKVKYDVGDMPQNLHQYLESAKRCVNPKCKGVYFSSRFESVNFVDFCGKYRLPLLQYLCTPRCTTSQPSVRGNSDTDTDEEDVANGIMKKVLLG
ncbi:leucine-rich repeat-containing protein 58 [Octopus bimaculoides]|uniref:Disease resistance R13L4/SHOC-2-like LRR domain-containing protein n=1 Tax=Octopus bimaculoides TaxID=37653 RepID=A0A0L8HY59_OCTBM|nr:leucine-rich repeat-containing protein 58 [Octopus bimaculoides]|eukprot:XP_014768429.1 PREDICTED: leucine-rich repeat-containing protein 58-like [Octopus bimaculoides]